MATAVNVTPVVPTSLPGLAAQDLTNVTNANFLAKGEAAGLAKADLSNANPSGFGDLVLESGRAAFDSRSFATTATIPSDVNTVEALGYAGGGDGGYGIYKRVSSEPTHEGKFQSADGAWWEYAPGPEGVNVKAFGAKGDNSTDDTTAIQNALDYAGTVDNTTGPVRASPTSQVVIPRGAYKVGKLTVPPGTTIRGAGPDATMLVAVTGHADHILNISRPSSIPSSRTRNYGVDSLTIIGSSTTGCVGIYLTLVAEVEIHRVNITSCDYGIDCPSDWVTGTIDRCKIFGNTTRGIRLLNGSNGIHIRNTRLQTTASGANIEIDGGATLQSLGNLLDNCIIESALHATNGQGVLIGATYGAVATTLVGCYFENNKTHCIQVGSSTAAGPSDVTVIGGQMAKGSNDPYGVLNYGGVVSVIGLYMESITSNKRLVMESSSGSATPRLFSTLNYVVSGTKADTAIANGLAVANNAGTMGELRVGGQTSAFGGITIRTNDVKFDTDKSAYLFEDAPFQSNFAGRATVGAGGTVAVALPVTLPNSTYAVLLTPSSANVAWVSGRTTSGFTINGNAGDTVYWHIHRHF